ncbi:MAG TPA: hypothetical protein VHM64_01890 [Candidatus Binatia bacterium]|nr:hypothetical protein [Candidatus Binatia bacterium]
MQHIRWPFRTAEPVQPLRQSRRSTGTAWRIIMYLAALLPLLLLLVVAKLNPDLNRTATPDWRALISRAEEARITEDWYRSRHLYLQAQRIATWRDDWAGLVAAACGIYRLDGVEGPYSKPYALLVRAALIAERAKSRRGIDIVTRAFALIGAEKAAQAVSGRSRPNWPDEANDFDAGQLLEACRAQNSKAAEGTEILP